MVKNLTVPDSVESHEVSNKNFRVSSEAPTASVVIETGGTVGEASGRNTYRPSPAKARAIAEDRGEIRRVPKIDAPVRKIHGADYMSAKDTEKRLKVGNKEILRLAKELYEAESDQRARYKKAKEIVDAADDEDLENPGPRLKKAMAIVKKGFMTKKKAKAKAVDRIDLLRRTGGM